MQGKNSLTIKFLLSVTIWISVFITAIALISRYMFFVDGFIIAKEMGMQIVSDLAILSFAAITPILRDMGILKLRPVRIIAIAIWSVYYCLIIYFSMQVSMYERSNSFVSFWIFVLPTWLFWCMIWIVFTYKGLMTVLGPRLVKLSIIFYIITIFTIICL